MADPGIPASAPPALPPQGAEALAAAADGLAVLIRLLDHEADADAIAGLRRARAGAWLAEMMPVGAGRDAGGALQTALDQLPDAPDAATLDELAADYADTFLTHGYRLAPNGSVWMTEERLERQEPMFEVRDWLDHYDLSVPDWRKRADDHLVHLLQFVHHLLGRADAVAAQDAARFLDLHVLPWVPEFGRCMAERCQTALYAATGAVLAEYPGALRDLLTALTGIEPRIAALPADKPNPQAPDQTLYIPGAAESW